MLQAGLFDEGSPAFDDTLRPGRRDHLGQQAWLDHRPGWLRGHQQLFEELLGSARWQHQTRQMYDCVVAVPRLTAPLPREGSTASFVRRIAGTLSAYYRRSLTSVALACYRDGHDSVAPHGDKMGSLAGDTVIAILSLGSPRRFKLRALDGSVSRQLRLGWGDLVVMGGSCQKTFLHGVPKVAHAAPRISVQFREALPDAEGERLSSGLSFSRTVSPSFASS